MATSKTLTPTNVTISIPEFTDQPDQRVNSNCIDKEADAINALKTLIDTATLLSPSVYQGRVTIDIANCYQIGKWVVVYMKLHSNQALSGNTIITGLPTPGAKLGLSVNLNGAYVEVRSSSGDGFVAYGISSNTDFIVTGVYNTVT